MTDPKTIILSTDTTEDTIEGAPKPLTPEGEVVIQPSTDNPDETVQLGNDFTDDSGVEISKEVEQEFSSTPPPHDA